MSCTVSGEDSVDSLFEEITDSQIRKVANDIGDIVAKEMKSSIAIDTGKSKSSVKKRVRVSEDGAIVTIKPTSYYYHYQEFGTSKDKSNIGKIAKAIESTKGKCIDTAKEVIKSR